eukprot:4593251-Pleurochrysis_carterae.AAC.2
MARTLVMLHSCIGHAGHADTHMQNMPPDERSRLPSPAQTSQASKRDAACMHASLKVELPAIVDQQRAHQFSKRIDVDPVVLSGRTRNTIFASGAEA